MKTFYSAVKVLFVYGALAFLAFNCLKASAECRADLEALGAELDAMDDEEPTTKRGFEYKRYLDRDVTNMARVLGFECGYCCIKCKTYTASALVNRYINWYGKDSEAMICDNNGEYYQMNPDYLWVAEVNGFDFYDNWEWLVQIIDDVYFNPIDVYYWDCEDSQGDWAELVWYCDKDGMYFYR